MKRKLLFALMSATILTACNNDESAPTSTEEDTEVTDSTEKEKTTDTESGASETKKVLVTMN